MYDLLRHRLVEEDLKVVYVDRLPVGDIKSGGLVHPGVDADDQERRRTGGDQQWDSQYPVPALKDSSPSVNVEAQEDRFDEECDAFEREDESNDAARELYPTGEQESELERDQCPRYCTDGEQQGEYSRPPDRHLAVYLIAGARGL